MDGWHFSADAVRFLQGGEAPAHGARKAWLVELIWSSNAGGAQWYRIRRASRTRTVTLRSCGRRRGCGLPCQTTRAVASPARCAGEANPSDAYADKRGR